MNSGRITNTKQKKTQKKSADNFSVHKIPLKKDTLKKQIVSKKTEGAKPQESIMFINKNNTATKTTPGTSSIISGFLKNTSAAVLQGGLFASPPIQQNKSSESQTAKASTSQPSMSAHKPTPFESVKSYIGSFFSSENKTGWSPDQQKEADSVNQKRSEKVNEHAKNALGFALTAPLAALGLACTTKQDIEDAQAIKDKSQRIKNQMAIRAFREFMESDNTKKTISKLNMSFDDFERRLDTLNGKNSRNGQITRQNVQDYFSGLDEQSKQKFNQKELNRMLGEIAPASKILPLGMEYRPGFVTSSDGILIKKRYNYEYIDGVDIDYRDYTGNLYEEKPLCRGKWKDQRDEAGVYYSVCSDDEILDYDRLR